MKSKKDINARKPKSVKFQVRIPVELADIVDEFCQKNERSRSWIIRRALIFVFFKELGEKRVKKFFDKLRPWKNV
ncbi:MAG TPA: ribbon-helix-helix domain-containing protein [Nitrospirota bacterium]|nr:ribbon-helix-helix domain-containing protein [Nitrospirota bacterium]